MRGRRRAGPLRGGVPALGARTPDARVRRLPPRARDRLGQWRRGLPVNSSTRPGSWDCLDHVHAAHPVARRPLHAREAEPFAALWCYVGWLMGVARRWLPFDERAGLRMMYQIGASSPAADEHSYALAASLVDCRCTPTTPGSAAAPPLPVRAGPVAGHHAAGPAGVRALRVPVRRPGTRWPGSP
ncbi:DUF2236 domain-containing protein [Rhodococcus hoagii]|nr:DUF2236 domain-containing protein [Prescottella equi]